MTLPPSRSTCPGRVASRYLRATRELTPEWVAGQREGLEALLRIPVDGGDWAECGRRTREVAQYLMGVLDALDEASRGHPYLAAELRGTAEEWSRYGNNPREYERALEVLRGRSTADDPLWGFWVEWVGAKWRREVKTVEAAVLRAPYVSDYHALAGMSRLRSAARDEGLDPTRASPELTAWLRKKGAGPAGARKGLLESSYVNPRGRLNGLFAALSAEPRTDESYGAVRQFNLGRATVVILDSDRSPEYDRSIAKAYAGVFRQLQRTGLGAVWYGPLFHVSRDQGKLTAEEVVEARALGYDLTQYAGRYNPGTDAVWVHGYADEAATTLAHELGHRHGYRFLTRTQRARFAALVSTRPVELSEDALLKYQEGMDYLPGDTYDDGTPKPVPPVSPYGGTNPVEAYAEAFAHYVRGKSMTPEQRASFRWVVGLQ